MTSKSDDLLKAEIERLTGAINRHKSRPPPSYRPSATRILNKTAYVNPAYRPPSKSIAPVASSSKTPLAPREVVLDGVAFQSSSRSLVRKELAVTNPAPAPKPPQLAPKASHSSYAYGKTYSENRVPHRPYKPKSAGRFARGKNLTLTNGRKPLRTTRKAMKLVDKQCSKFSTTGVCSRGRTCPYRHDPQKIAICWPFLQGLCPNTADACQLSHDATPERAPLCVHFANNGRCKNGAACLFPHVHVGPRSGVCRDFAVLGYCERGIECEKQHVRECPDFAENGVCPDLRCKLPHVIRASRRRAAVVAKGVSPKSVAGATDNDLIMSDSAPTSSDQRVSQNVKEFSLGDEFISLTFHESGESDDEEDEEEEEEDEGSVKDEDDDDAKVNLQVVA